MANEYYQSTAVYALNSTSEVNDFCLSPAYLFNHDFSTVIHGVTSICASCQFDMPGCHPPFGVGSHLLVCLDRTLAKRLETAQQVAEGGGGLLSA